MLTDVPPFHGLHGQCNTTAVFMHEQWSHLGQHDQIGFSTYQNPRAKSLIHTVHQGGLIHEITYNCCFFCTSIHPHFHLLVNLGLRNPRRRTYQPLHHCLLGLIMGPFCFHPTLSFCWLIFLLLSFLWPPSIWLLPPSVLIFLTKCSVGAPTLIFSHLLHWRPSLNPSPAWTLVQVLCLHGAHQHMLTCSDKGSEMKSFAPLSMTLAFSPFRRFDVGQISPDPENAQWWRMILFMTTHLWCL